MKRSKKIRGVINGYDCSLCEKRFITKHTMQRHMSLHLGTEQFHCTVCKKDFTSDYNLKRHKASVHEELDIFDCTRCNKYFMRRSNYERHMKTHIDQNDFPYECNICLQAFSENKTLLSHITSHSEMKPSFSCNLCPKVFIHRAGLNRHKLIHTSKKPYKCFMCGLEFPDVASRSRHVMHHSVFCGLCKISLKDEKDFKSHVINVHKPKQRFSKNMMKNAKKWVETSKPGDNTCVTENSHSHMLFNEDEVVEGNKKFASDVKGNSSLNNLSNWFHCSECGRQFADVFILRNHQFMHIKEKHTCSKCLPALSEPKVYEAHIETCSPNLLCMHCSTQFITDKDLECHLKLHDIHEELPVNEENNDIHESSKLKSSNNILNSSSNDEFSNANSVKIQNQLAQQAYVLIQHETNEGINSNIENHWNMQSNFVNSHTNLISQNSDVANTVLDSNVEYYIGWLSEFLNLCKSIKLPFSNELIELVNQVHMTVLKRCCNPVGIIKQKMTFVSLMHIQKELLELMHRHWEYVCDEFME